MMKEALEEELEILKKEEREAARISTLGEVVISRRDNDNEFSETVVGGMTIGAGLGADEESEDEDEGYKPKPTKRKTQAQRNKIARTKAKLLEAREAASRKRTEQAILSAKKTNKDLEARKRAVEEAVRSRKAAAVQREKVGYEGGEKIGKHRVSKGAVAVQLGEDLAESLRQVKVSFSCKHSLTPAGGKPLQGPFPVSPKACAARTACAPASQEACPQSQRVREARVEELQVESAFMYVHASRRVCISVRGDCHMSMQKKFKWRLTWRDIRLRRDI